MIIEERGRKEKGWGTKVGLSLLLISFSLLPLSSPAQLRPGRVLRPVRAAATMPPVLQRALQAADGLRFTGRRTVTVLKDGQPNRHDEIVMRDGPQIRIEFPNDGAYAGQVIVENETERRHFNPATNQVRVLLPRRDEGLQRLRGLARSGRVTVAPGERIAGYATTELLVRDKAGNPLQRLAIEPDSGMVLRRVVYDATGVQVGGFAYSRVDLNPGAFDPALFHIERKGVQTTTPWDTLRRLAKKGGYAAVGLPEVTGFRLDSARLARSADTPALQQIYVGPGGARLSLFQLRGSIDPDSLRRVGAKRLHTLSWTDGGLTYVLLGPQDDATLARLKGSIGR